MTEKSFTSAGVTARVINRTSPTSVQPSGIPAGVIGAAEKGPAFIPVTVATDSDFVVDFGLPTNERSNGPLASLEWLRNSNALTFLRVLGAGNTEERTSTGNNAGKVTNAGFVVGNRLPQRPGGAFGNNKYVFAPGTGDEGRVYFLGCFMAQSGSSTYFSDAGKPSVGNPVVRGVLMAPSGVLLTLSSSRIGSNTPSLTGSVATATGAHTGSLLINSGKQEFVMLLNGFNNSENSGYKNILTASFDPTAVNYIDRVFNTDPYKIEERGHLLYADYKIWPALAIPTGSGVVNSIYGIGAVSGSTSSEDIAFLLTSSLGRNVGSSTVPSFENFEDRFRTAETVQIISQKFGGLEENLFKISALSDGQQPNSTLKFSIENITPGTDAQPYGRFDLIVRDFYDTDKNQVVYEAWRGLDLDPDSERYIARIIGDTKNFFNFDASEDSQKIITEGTYENKSRYIRVEMANKVTNKEVDSTALPFGFRGAPHFVTSGSAPMKGHIDSGYIDVSNPFYNLIQIPVPMRENLAVGVAPNKSVEKGYYWGVQFTEKTSVTEPNAGKALDTTMFSLAKYFPNFQTTWQNFVVSNNQGAADTAENGVLDADRFLNNKFSLNNVRIEVDSSDTPVTSRINSWTYVRSGNVATTSTSRSLDVSDLSDSSVRNVAKFSFFMHGGFDGTNLLDRPSHELRNEAIVEEMNNTNRGVNDAPTVSAYNKALSILGDTTEVDIQLLAVPGIRHSVVTDNALLVTEERFDALYLMDIEQYDTFNALVTGSGQILSVRNTANQFSNRGLNSSFGAAYFPDVILRDNITKDTRIVPPSVAALGAYAKNDALAHPWFAPAGFTRGALETTDASTLNLSRPNIDTLQEKDINPMVSFAGSDGVVIWGQKTLLATDSSLERVNVRRLLIDVRRKVRTVAYRVLFEQNREETLARFSQLVNPILKNIQDKKGVEKYLVKIDTTTTTQADIENKTIRGKIFLTPTKTLEFLSVDFVVTNEGA